MTPNAKYARIVRKSLQDADVDVRDVEVREYPEESIVVVYVDPGELQDAIELASEIEDLLKEAGLNGFLTVKAANKGIGQSSTNRPSDLTDQRIADLVNLLTARSRTTELQPSLEYIPDARNCIASVNAPRHHLVFGRRGSGKTALLAETKRLVESNGGLAIWLNLQTYRRESESRVFLYVAQRFCQLIQSHYVNAARVPQVVADANEFLEDVEDLLSGNVAKKKQAEKLVPQLQRLIRRFIDTAACELYIFLDDFHYLEQCDQPRLLDLIHGSVRDCNAWLKIATIQHLTRWFDAAKQEGLQVGHDAASINLDITLQDPGAAQKFLQKVLASYAHHCDVDSINHVFAQAACDRLALASGAVPRDYLTLCSSSIQEARRRPKAKLVGVQDVNKAAGDAKQKKVDELEDDAAREQESQTAIDTLQAVRRFCLEEANWTYFRIDFLEKDTGTSEYAKLQVLADLRFIHLVEPSLSDERKAGHRSEVYMLDLSQFAGHRLRRKLNVLDLVSGNLVLKRTGTQQVAIVGSTANKRLSVLRRAPLMSLSRLS